MATYLKQVSPTLVTETFERLMKSGRPVSYLQVAATLAAEGHLNPQTKRAYTRQFVAQVLNNVKNKRGQRAVAENKQRRLEASPYAKLG